MQLLAGALKVRSEMAASETGSPAWPGARSGSGSTVSVLVAVAIVVADMVGVGVFTSLGLDRKSTRLNSSHQISSYAVFCLKKTIVSPGILIGAALAAASVVTF